MGYEEWQLLTWKEDRETGGVTKLQGSRNTVQKKRAFSLKQTRVSRYKKNKNIEVRIISAQNV